VSSVKERCDRHLGGVCTWMLGDFAGVVDRNQAELKALDLRPGVTGVAVDLGAGAGNYALALASRGFMVVAVDTCAILNGELRERAVPGIDVIDADLRRFRAVCPAAADAVLCMGDTLTHLDSGADVAQLLDDVAHLDARGLLVQRDATPSGMVRIIARRQ
jgi:SAM-dependent methyltransferase